MGLFDNLKDRFRGSDSYDDYDDGYDDGYYGDDGNGVSDPEPRSSRRRSGSSQSSQAQGSGLLGNTPRPEAESVSVYTRSGRPVASNAGAGFAQQQTTESAYSAGHGYASAPDTGYAPRSSYSSDDGYGADSYGASEPTDTSVSAPVPRVTSGQLPPYILKPESYNDVQMVVRRVRTNQPVVLVLTETPADVAQHVLDFCFGLSCGINGDVEQLADSVFCVLPEGISLTKADIDKLVADGDLKK